jgi:cyclopropane fatty-acyl-phospholipid synthase-like methyltransferase
MLHEQAERNFWESAAADLDTARCQIWAEAEEGAWEAGVAACLSALSPLDEVLSLPGARCLDLGCGLGRLLIPLALRYPATSFMGVDISPGMLEHARKQAKAHGVRNVRWLSGSGRMLPRVGMLTAALCAVTFQHIPSTAVASYIGQVGERLQPGGMFRFQFVHDTRENAFLTHGLHETDVVAWCEHSGLRVKDLDLSLIYPVWTWVTAVKA